MHSLLYQVSAVLTLCLISWLSGGCAHAGPTALQRATLLADKGRFDEASTLLRQHLVEHPDALPEHRLLVRVLAAAGRMDEVQTEIERLRRDLGPSDPVPWLELGHAFELQHDYEQALSMYDQAAQVAPANPAGPLTGGMRAARWGEVELAAPRLEEALRRDPSDAAAWHALGLVRFHMGNRDGARVAYVSGLQANPKSTENRIGLASLALSADDLEGALHQYDSILEDRPGFADAHLGRSFVLMRLGRLKEARETLETGYRLGANPVVVARQRALLDRLEANR